MAANPGHVYICTQPEAWQCIHWMLSNAPLINARGPKKLTTTNVSQNQSQFVFWTRGLQKGWGGGANLKCYMILSFLHVSLNLNTVVGDTKPEILHLNCCCASPHSLGLYDWGPSQAPNSAQVWCNTLCFNSTTPTAGCLIIWFKNMYFCQTCKALHIGADGPWSPTALEP